MATRLIELGYSVDDGNNFVTTEYTCNIIRGDLNCDYNDLPKTGNGKLNQITQSHIELEIHISHNEIDPNATANKTTANTNYIHIQKWLAAPIRRIVNKNTTDYDLGLGGFTDFDGTSNTNYVNVTDYDYEYRKGQNVSYYGSTNPDDKVVKIVVLVRDRYIVT